ncbi:MAG: S8 family serine peptidase [bacterium]|nr:S8 family serine peptidase [bacterium]
MAVADWGCDLKHPDFQNKSSMAWKKLAGSFNFRTMTPDTKDDKHGTKSAGMAAAVSDNERGVAGLAPGCQLLPVRKGLRLSDIADMYVWAAGFDPKNSSPKFPKKLKRGADVISSSFSVMDKPMSAVMKAAFDFITTYGRNGKGCVVVFSVGNNAKDLAKLNAREWVKYERTIGVAYSTTKTPEKRGVTSNYGTSVDLCAPSEGITCTTTNIGEGSYIGYKNANSKDYDDFGQTSCACPQVSGLAALMLSVNPDLTWIEVRQILRDTAVKIDSSNNDVNGKWSAGFSKWYGYGRISAEAAVKAAKAYKPKWDIFVRDNINDKGTVPSTGRFSNTPDLWVRNNAPTIDKNSKPKSYNDLPPHQDPIAGQDNWIYVRYKNIGLQTSQKFYVRVYVANYPGYQYQYPDNFIPVNKSGTAITPSTMQPETYLIGETSDTGVVGNGWKIANVKWPSNLIPPKTITVNGKATKWSPCLLVEVTPHDGPKPSGNKIPDNNNLAQKNVTILYEKTDEDDSFEVTTIMGDPVNRSEYAVLLADTEMMPPAFRLYVEFSDDEVRARLREFEGDPQYNFSFGEHLGREVVWLGERGETRIPVFSNSRLTPVIVGGFREGYVEPGNYTLTLTQLEPSGRPTGEYSVEIRVQATQLLEKALSEVYKLPIERQDEIATLIIEKLKT